MEKDQNKLCTNRSHHGERFLKVCLLVLLFDEPGYGYGFIEKLSYFGFSKDELNKSTVYRTLRKMEKEKLVTSLWKKGIQGPKRRVYKINDKGKSSLEKWVEFLKIRQYRISKLIEKYDEKIEK